MTFEEIYLSIKNGFKKDASLSKDVISIFTESEELIYNTDRKMNPEYLPKDDLSLYIESKELIDKADRKMNPEKYEELSRKFEEAMAKAEEERHYERLYLESSSSTCDPEDEVIRAIENGNGEYFGY